MFNTVLFKKIPRKVKWRLFRNRKPPKTVTRDATTEVSRLPTTLQTNLSLWTSTKCCGSIHQQFTSTEQPFLIYEGREDRRKQDARWTASITYNDRTVMYRMDIVHLDYEDDRGLLFAYIVDVCTGEEVAVSTSGRAIHVDQNCPESSPFGGKVQIYDFCGINTSKTTNNQVAHHPSSRYYTYQGIPN